MIYAFINMLKNLFSTDSAHSALEAYIVAGNPQDVGDVDRLEREYYRQQENRRQANYY